jgi:hypothetical protein
MWLRPRCSPDVFQNEKLELPPLLQCCLRRSMGHPTRVMVQPARYSIFDRDRWWETRDGVRTEIVELQKLVLEIVLHPLSF